MERSNREMFRQFEEQSRRDEELPKENRAMRQKNRTLEKRATALEIHFEDRIARVVQGHTISIPADLAQQVAAGKAEHIIRDETNGAEKYSSDWIVELKIIPVYTEIRRLVGKPPVIQ